MTAALIGGGLLLTACSGGSGGPKVASLGAATDAGPSANPSASAGPLAYSHCMRSHGVPSFPDPDGQGRLSIQAGPGSALDPGSAVFQAAQSACQSLQPVPTAAEQAKAHAQLLKMAQCMRAQGIGDFPDPDPQGRLSIGSGSGSDLDPSNPQFQSAQKVCQKYAPGGKGMGTVTQGNGPGRTGGKP
ncbi:MAG: hypothetical protein QOG99_2290 [Frankiales bacterium]|jgi:hypothetical protein|nr:hypothetical protein [Frankiales bacterium]